MIGHLRGSVLRAAPEAVLIEVGGVGYNVQIPLSTYYELEQVSGEVALHVYTHVRDDALQLFGFWTAHEKQLFERLIAISGIGPRLAQTILSGMPPGDLAAALTAGDLVRLNAIPGVGKKTAQRMVLELKDKVSDLATPRAPLGAADGDVVAALVNLGYRKVAASRAVTAAREEAPDAAFSDLLRASLQRLSRA